MDQKFHRQATLFKNLDLNEKRGNVSERISNGIC